MEARKTPLALLTGRGPASQGAAAAREGNQASLRSHTFTYIIHLVCSSEMGVAGARVLLRGRQ